MTAATALTHSHSARFDAAAVVTVAGGAAVVAGTVLPWLSTAAGLQVLTGLDGVNGRLLAGGGLAAILAGLVALKRASAVWASAMLGFALLAFSSWLLVALLGTLRELAANPLVLAQAGPGLFVTTAGAAAVFSPLLWKAPAAPARTSTAPSALWPISLAVAAVVAGLVHVAVSPQHMGEHLLLGAGMLAVGVAQLGLAPAVLLRPSRTTLRLAVIGNAAAIVVWALAGAGLLPLTDHAGGDGAAAVVVVAEVVVITAALRIARVASRGSVM